MVRQFLFKDFTVLKVLLTAIIVGGIGMVLYGYCPGTAVAAIGTTGRRRRAVAEPTVARGGNQLPVGEPVFRLTEIQVGTNNRTSFNCGGDPQIILYLCVSAHCAATFAGLW